MSTKPGLAPRIGAFVGALTALTACYIVATVAGRDDFARGVIIGGGATLALLAILWWRGARGGTAAHVASGLADEREKAIARGALAHTAVAMFYAGVGGAIASLWDVEGIVVAGIVLWVGVITFAISFAVHARRG